MLEYFSSFFYTVILMLGKRIAVWGMSSSGKTTLAAELARRLGVAHIEIDSIFWRPGWEETPVDEFRAAIAAALDQNQDGWVIDGNYAQVQGSILPRADTVVWLHVPLPILLFRLVRRTLGRIITGELLWGTNRETFRDAFFSRDSLFMYVVKTWRTYPASRSHLLATIPHEADVVMVRSKKEMKALLAEMG